MMLHCEEKGDQNIATDISTRTAITKEDTLKNEEDIAMTAMNATAP